MNKYHMIGAIIAVAMFFSFGFFYRSYKRIARRCRRKGCGRTDVKRVCKILLPPDESVSWRSPGGKWRWFIRRPIKLTFTVCGCKWVELVKIDTDPISMWHALWVKRFYNEQYFLADPVLTEVTRLKLRQLHYGGKHENLDPGATDTPLMSLDVLFQGCFDELFEIVESIGEKIGGGGK